MYEYVVKFVHSDQTPDEGEIGISLWANDEYQAKRAARILLPSGPVHYTSIVSVEQRAR